MKINEKLIEKLFNHKIKLKKEEDKIELSEYEEIIPMYDIYTNQIYPVDKKDILLYLDENSYRFIDKQLVENIINIFEKYKKKYEKTNDKDQKNRLLILLHEFSNMIKIIRNYNIDILTNTSYESITKSTLNNLSISICQRNSFHPFITYLKPYYSKLELIKLGQNMNKIDKTGHVDALFQKEIEYEVCMLTRINDIAFNEIKNHSITIFKNSKITDVTFYSYIGASLLNRFLRFDFNTKTLNKFYYERLKNIVSIMKKTPGLKKDYQIYRFINDDKFLKNKKIGEIFTDNGFLSTTRNPFYSSGINGTFGLILVKVHLKKNVKATGLFIEHFSLFPKEEEFLLAPFTKLRLISKNNNFKYYHTNEEFEDKIYKKYELEFVGLDYNWIKKIKIKEEPIKELDFNMTDVPINIFKNISNKYHQVKINNLIFNYYVFDATQSYRKFYYNKIENGISLIHFDKNGYPSLVFELGDELAVNYINQYYFYNDRELLSEKDILDIIILLGKMFNYKKALIFHSYDNFSKFKSNYLKIQEVFLNMKHYDRTLYNYLKHNKKPFKSEKRYYDNFKKIDSIVNKSIPKDIHFKTKETSIKKAFIDTVENYFDDYEKFCKYFKLDALNYGELILGNKNNHLELKEKDYVNEETYNLVYRQIFDRIN